MKFSNFASDEELASEIFNVCINLVFDEGDAYTEHLNRIGQEARLIYLLWCFDGEIHSGGFDQLFFSSRGDHCIEILEGLKKIGASKSAQLLESAIKWFPSCTPSQNRADRCSQLEQYEDNHEYENSLEKLNEEFWRYEDNLVELLHKFVRENPHAKVNA